MNRELIRSLIRFYPRAWRERYGAEFEELLTETKPDLGTLLDIAFSGVRERVVYRKGGMMEQPASPSFAKVVRNPSALIPMAMSLIALALVLGNIAMSGTGPEVVVNGRPDEGPIAHLWQILMAGQLPVLAFFAIKWLPRAPRPTLGVLGMQAGAVLAAMAPVWYFNL